MQSDQFSYRSESSKIRGTREEPHEPPSTDWGRTIYLTFLALIALVLIYYAISSYMTIDGEGRVISGSLTLRAPTDIRIMDLFSREGGDIEAGDSLFAYKLADWNENLDSLKSVNENRRDLQLQLRNTNREIDLTRQQLKGAQKQLRHLRERKDLIVQEIRLNVQTPARIHSIEQQIVELQSRANVLKQKLRNLDRKRAELRSDLNNLPALTAYGGEQSGGLRIFRSPVKGKVGNIYADIHGMLMNSERIMTLNRDTSDIMIRVSFGQSSVKYLKKGKKLTLRFSNGVNSVGIIKDFYMTYTDYLRSKKWIEGVHPSNDIFSSTDVFYSEPRVVVELKPANDKVEDTWRANEHIGVEVLIQKIDLWPTISQ